MRNSFALSDVLSELHKVDPIWIMAALETELKPNMPSPRVLRRLLTRTQAGNSPMCSLSVILG